MENIYAKCYERPSSTRQIMTHSEILKELSVISELKKQTSLPTILEVVQGYNYRFNELKSILKVNPPFIKVARLVEKDVMVTWEYASLEKM